MTSMTQWRGAAVALCMVMVSTRATAAELPADAIAKVGDQVITMHQIDTMINSSAVVGMTIPAPGTPERNRARLTLLDKIISADLLYLDAKREGLGDTPVVRSEVRRYEDSTLAQLYKQKYLVGDLKVTEEEVTDFFHKRIKEGTELTDDLKAAIEAKIRKARFKERIATLRERLRKGSEVTLHKEVLDPASDRKRKPSAVVAELDGTPITWGEVSSTVSIAPTLAKRVEMVEELVDDRLMARKGREAGLEKEPIFQARLGEFQKVRLINLRRDQLVDRFAPKPEEIRAYYKKHREKIAVPESRKIQMVVLKTRKEAEEVKAKIDKGEITIFEAARDYSIDPNAKKTLGEIGWVPKGSGFPKLDALAFSLEKGVLGGPVESPAGWHLVKVLDQRDPQLNDIADKRTYKKVRRMMIHARLDEYTRKLRKESFPVEIYQETLNRILQQEVAAPEATKETAESHE